MSNIPIFTATSKQAKAKVQTLALSFRERKVAVRKSPSWRFLTSSIVLPSGRMVSQSSSYSSLLISNATCFLDPLPRYLTPAQTRREEIVASA